MKNQNIKKRYHERLANAFHINRFKAFVFVLPFALISCRKLIDIKPPVTEIAQTSVFSTNASASAAMTGIYDQMEVNGNGLTDGHYSISYFQSLAADELTDYSSGLPNQSFYKNALSGTSAGGGSNSYYWQELYNEIYSCNAVLQGLSASTGVTPAMKQQLTGEAKFMRAFLYFYAVNLYGDVPLALTTSYTTNEALSRSPKTLVYQQIIQDLKDAQTALSKNYVDQNGNTTSEKIRPNYWAATALLARAYLYTANWKDAVAQASAVISSNNFSLPSDLTQVFLANSPEAILQFYPVDPLDNTIIAHEFVLTSAPGTGNANVALSTFLLNSFEPGDLRFANWVGNFTSGGQTYYYANKYKVYLQNQPVTEYFMLLRLGEQYLIRAEAEAEDPSLGNATSDLNVIRNRAGLPNYSAASNGPLLTAILHERQVELFTEWGHRWFDLIRTNNINSVMASPGNVCAAKGGTWNPDWALMPLPQSELLLDKNLVQNPGY